MFRASMLKEITDILYASAGKPIKTMRNALDTKIRSGNKMRQKTTGRTAQSINAAYPKVDNINLLWDFNADESALRLNNGGSLRVKGFSEVPFSGIGGGGKSQYIEALIKWAIDKKLAGDRQSAMRIAFRVANAAKDRGRTVKARGWFDDLQKEIERQIKLELEAAVSIVVNNKIDKALKLK